MRVLQERDSELELISNCLQELAILFSATKKEELPYWFVLPGKDWPISQWGHQYTSGRTNHKLDSAVGLIQEIPPSSLTDRWENYQSLIQRGKFGPLWLHESLYVNGKIPGPVTFQVSDLYKQAGLAIHGAEMPDHISWELAFLAYLIIQENEDTEKRDLWRTAKSLFVNKHLGKWLPKVADQLIGSNFSEWNAIGTLLPILIELSIVKERNFNNEVLQKPEIPFIDNPENCSLCGFCVQVCPSKALGIIEDDINTALWLRTSICTHCGKCENVCPEKVIGLHLNYQEKSDQCLRKSPRASCPDCETALVSQAELEFAGKMLGYPKWLAYCMKCRINITEK